MGALIRTADPSHLLSVIDFLHGLSYGEMECLAEYQGASLLEAINGPVNLYRMLSDFFDPEISGCWRNSDDRAHKMFIVISWLEVQKAPHRLLLTTHAA
jgi:hypothetical protein